MLVRVWLERATHFLFSNNQLRKNMNLRITKTNFVSKENGQTENNKNFWYLFFAKKESKLKIIWVYNLNYQNKIIKTHSRKVRETIYFS